MTTQCFLEPLDVLFLRGNKLFGDPGSYGESLVPPWPSVAAGAIRSKMMADAGIDFQAFIDGEAPPPELGTLDQPGTFAITGFWLARRGRDGVVETLHSGPADLTITRENGHLNARLMQPIQTPASLATSQPLPKMAVAAADAQVKPIPNVWLSSEGWAQYLAGHTPTADNIVESGDLWSLDHRVGVGLDTEKRRAEEGKLFSVQAVVLREGNGFLAAFEGARPPSNGTLRFGGDGRAAAISTVECSVPKPNFEAISKNGRCRIVLTSPGIFPQGWRLPGMDKQNRFALGDVRGRLVCATVPRSEVVSGWDLARRAPKPAQRAAPTGSVYWLEELEATPESLHKLAKRGLWPEADYDVQRRAEGFNCFTFATY